MEHFQIIVSCADISPLVNFIKKGIWPVIQFIIPLLIIILGAVDLGKAVAGGDEKKTKEAQSAFMKRIIYGVAIFFVPLIVNLIFTTLQDQSKDDPDGYTFVDCWNYAGNSSKAEEENDCSKLGVGNEYCECVKTSSVETCLPLLEDD